MDTRELIFLFEASIDQERRAEAEELLAQMRNTGNFVARLLQVVILEDVAGPVRQAGAIYLKREIESRWTSKEPLSAIPEDEREFIRDAIVDAVAHAPELIRLQLAQCVCHVVKQDFPARWPTLVDKISCYLTSADPVTWSGTLLSLYQLVKNYEYKKPEERGPLNSAMTVLLPLVHRLAVGILPDRSRHSVLLQKQILKTFFALTQYALPLNLLTKDVFSRWMEVCRQVVDLPVPEEALQAELDSGCSSPAESPWWKCKKWALHILYRIFKRYGSPGNVIKEYQDFSEWFLETFSGGIMEMLLKILDQYRRGMFVAPRVLQQTLNYMNQSVSHATSWRFLKPHMSAIVQGVLFPLMSHTDADEVLWRTDPYEYVRVKFDIFEDFVSPVTAAQALLHSAATKRKNVLQETLTFVMQVLTWSNADAKHKDGALHMLGALADVLNRKKPYRDEIDSILRQHVFPEFSSPLGHMRARACWVLHNFSEAKLSEETLADAVGHAVNAFLGDVELPVKVESAIAIQTLLNFQHKTHRLLEPRVKAVTLELLSIIRDTENDDLTNVIQKIVSTFPQELTSIAVDVCRNLVATFQNLLRSGGVANEKPMTGMGLLNAVATLLTSMDESSGVVTQLEPTVIQVIRDIFQQDVSEFYEEALILTCHLTSRTVSPELWHVLELMHTVFLKGGRDYFTDMMPTLHNFVTIDTEAFLSSPNRVFILFDMCKSVLSGDVNEDAQCHAAKLLEVLLLQCRGRIDQCLPPFLELALRRLNGEVTSCVVRTMCLQVIIAAFYYNFQLTLEILEAYQHPTNMSGESTFSRFIRQWIQDTDHFHGLHDRRLCVIGLCQFMSMTPNRPEVLNELAPRLLPALISLFDGLKRAYIAKAHEEHEQEDEETQSEDEGMSPLSDREDMFCRGDSLRSLMSPNALTKLVDHARRKIEVLSSDEDEIDETGTEYLEALHSSGILGQDIHEDLREYLDLEETALDSFETVMDDESSDVDEYVIFREVMTGLQTSDPAWHTLLTRGLTPEQQAALEDITVLADQRKAAADSKKIEMRGGYSFGTQAVPTTFNFGCAVATSGS